MSDRREAELLREVAGCRAAVMDRAHALEQSFWRLFDIRAAIRGGPMRGLAVSVATELLLGLFRRRKDAGARDGAASSRS